MLSDWVRRHSVCVCVCVCVYVCGYGQSKIKPSHSSMPYWKSTISTQSSHAGYFFAYCVKIRLISNNKSWGGGLGTRLTQSITGRWTIWEGPLTSLTNMVSTRPVDRQRNQPLASRNDRHPLPSGEAHEQS